jgi:hypothetical protein
MVKIGSRDWTTFGRTTPRLRSKPGRPVGARLGRKRTPPTRCRTLTCGLPTATQNMGLHSGRANPIITSYNASVVKIYNGTKSIKRFLNKIIFIRCKHVLAYYNAGVVHSCNFKSRRIGSWTIIRVQLPLHLLYFCLPYKIGLLRAKQAHKLFAYSTWLP